MLSLVLAWGPGMAQQTPPQNNPVERRLSPGGDETQQQRRGVQREDRDNRGLRGTPPQNLQQPQREQIRERRGTEQADQQQAINPRVQAYFAAKMILCNQGIVELSQLAREESNSDEVKQFAQKLAEGHSELNAKLQEAVPQAAQLAGIEGEIQQRSAGFRGGSEQGRTDRIPVEQPRLDEQPAQPEQRENLQPQRRPDRPAERTQRGERQTDRPARQDRAGAQVQRGSLDGPLGIILNIETQAAENQVEASKKLLERYEGQDFDMAFLGLQIGAHSTALAELKALENFGDQQFQEVVAEARHKMEEHLKEAKKLADQHEDREEQSDE